jgi:methanogenic corrinoid protein MtbC1
VKSQNDSQSATCPQLVEELVQYVGLGHQRYLYERVVSLLEAKGVEALDDVIGALLRIIGESTRNGLLSVGLEHMASEAVRAALFGFKIASHPASLRTPRKTRVLTGALPGQWHDIGAHMVRACCEMSQAHCVVVGSNTPIETYIDLALQLDIDMVAITVVGQGSVLSNYGNLMDNLITGLAGRATIVLGGSGAQYFRGRHSSISVVNSMRDFSTILHLRG